ncbi:GNAT family N-acetyltransferase/HAD family hydrolase [Vibrio breoganii]
MELCTARLSLTSLSEHDWTLFHSLHVDERVIELCFDKPSLKDIKLRFQARIQPWSKNSLHWLCLVITDRASGQQVGLTGFCMQDEVAEVGYMLLPEFHGKGYATESLQYLIDWARHTHGIEQFSATVTKGNLGSERVLEKAGFTLAKIIPDAYVIKGTSHTDHIYQRSIQTPSAVNTILFDWGDTLMVDLPDQQGKMCDWPEVFTVEGAIEALQELSKRYQIYVATNAEDSTESDIHKAFHRAGLATFISGYFCKANLGIGKGSAEFFCKIAQELGESTESMLMVGDTLDKDINPAIEAGLKVVWFNPHHTPVEGERDIPQIDTLYELPDAVKKLQ